MVTSCNLLFLCTREINWLCVSWFSVTHKRRCAYEIYSSLPALALMFTGQAYRRKISWFGDAGEAPRTPFAIADTNIQYRWTQITASLEMHQLTPENRLLSRDRAVKWLNTLLVHQAQIQPKNLIGQFLKEAELGTPSFFAILLHQK